MSNHQPNYRLTEGALNECALTEMQMWNAVNSILASKKRSTYKFAFLQSIINVSVLNETTSLQLPAIYENVATMYWVLLSKYPLRQIHKHARYEQSSIEKIMLDIMPEFPDVAFASLPDELKRKMSLAVQKICSRNVIGASYGNSDGVLFGFSNRVGKLELSSFAKSFFADNAAKISLLIELEWLLMMELLNPDIFPEPLILRIQYLKQEIDRLAPKEESHMSSVSPEAAAKSQGGLQHIHDYVVQANAILSAKEVELENSALDFEKELKSAFPDHQKEKLIFQSRVKGTGSLEEKIYRKNYYNRYPNPAELIDNLPDMIGIRIVCLLNQQEETLFNRLKAIYTDSVVIDEVTFHRKNDGRILFDFSNQPQKQKNGQPIYRITCKWDHPKLGYINCELQIKSMVHFFWGELDHMLFYKNYAYLISQSFYSQYMLKIENALSNINDQLVLLYKQIENNREGSRQEIREIASCVLYQHYHGDIEKQIGCPVDLREVFDIIVDMHFQNYGNQDKNIENLSKLIHDIASRVFRSELLTTVINGKLNPEAIPKADFQLAQIIDRIIKSYDVYWIAFVVTYGSHFWKEENTDYNVLLGEICRVLIRMVRSGFVDTVEQLYDELDSLYEKFRNAILAGILLAFKQKPQLDFFIFSSKLDKVKKISEETVLKTQKYMTDKNADECMRNLESITLYTYCKIGAELYDSIQRESLEKLMDLLQQEDPFSFEPNYDKFGSLKGDTNYTKQEFESIFAQGGA